MFTDNQVTRFSNGVTNVPVGNIFNSLRGEDDSLYHTYYEDFDYYAAANWTVTVVGSGTAALVTGDGGIIALTSSAGAADLVQIQKVGASFLPVLGKKTFFRARLKVDNATLPAVVVGLQIANTDASAAVTQGIYFIKAAAATSVSINSRFNTTTGAQTAVAGVMADDTYMNFELFYDGVDRLYYGLNNTVLGYLTINTTSGFPTVPLAPVFEVKNSTGVIRLASVDFMYVVQER